MDTPLTWLASHAVHTTVTQTDGSLPCLSYPHISYSCTAENLCSSSTNPSAPFLFLPVYFVCFLIPTQGHPSLILEMGERRGREKHWLPLAHAPTRDRTHNLGMSPDREIKPETLLCMGRCSNQLSYTDQGSAPFKILKPWSLFLIPARKIAINLNILVWKFLKLQKNI